MLLSGKTAFVSGASRGIGRAIALELAKSGCNVAINFMSNEEKAAQVQGAIMAMGAQALLVKGDVADFADSKRMVAETVQQWGRLDILVNNAGITRDGLILTMKEEDFDSVVETNLKGTFNLCKHAAAVMLKQRSGRIINLSSVVGLTGSAGQSNYCAAKAGIVGLTKALARELASRSITVNAIAPGFIETDMTGCLTDVQKEGLLKNIPMGRYGTAEEVASLACYLASDAAGYITGEVIRMDGGMGA
jgi:3-oxoacyl-[acyl-carrier protein] reductase